MRPHLFLVLFALLVIACRKDVVLPGSGSIGPVIDTVLTASDFAGTYYGRYERGGNSPFPPPGGSYSYVDTMDILVRADTGSESDPFVVHAGYESFYLDPDSTLICYTSSSDCDGRFYMMNDTLRLEFHRTTWDDFGVSSYANFQGYKH
jgi:hypothetical protein